MRFDVLTLFPGMFGGPLEASVLGRARERGLVTVSVHDLRAFAQGKHKVTDEPPFGGGGGMVLKPEPVFAGVEAIRERFGPGKAVLLSPQGELLSAPLARRLAGEGHLILVCGRYEGVDQRVRDHLCTDEISIGDYVLSGGEIPAMVLVDAVTRLLPGALGQEHGADEDSHATGLLEYPHYTRPPEFRGWRVPEVLLSGHHGQVRRWRREQALRRTRERRPDMLETAWLTEADLRFLAALEGSGQQDDQGGS